MPGVRIASSIGENSGIGVIDSEVESDDGIAAMNISLDESGRRCGCSVGSVMPNIMVASYNRLDAGITIMNCKMKGDNGVASCCIGFDKSGGRSG